MLFQCKQFAVEQSIDVFKITTDATLLGALALQEMDANKPSRVLEVGVGTGIISLMLAQRFPQAEIQGIDINLQAVNLAASNFNNSTFRARLNSKVGDVLNYSPSSLFDALVINPPYFEEATKASSPVDRISRHLSFSYHVLVEKLVGLVKTDGVISMIHPFRYKEQIEKDLPQGAYINKQILLRHYKRKPVRNMITEIKKRLHEDQSTEESIIIDFSLRDNQSSYSHEYVECLRDFLVIF